MLRLLLLALCILPLHAQRLERKVREAFDTGGYPSLAVAVVHGDDVPVMSVLGHADRASKRRATTDTLYRIGSVTKVFTTTLLVKLRDDGVVRLDDPVTRFLPEGVTMPSDPRGAKRITLRHLATHASGLPRNPVNLEGRDGDPWNGYGVKRLYDGLAATRLRFPTGASGQYSNLGMGLLGHALGNALGTSYEKALERKILGPLRMSSTMVRVSGRHRSRLATPYSEKNTTRPVDDWDLGCLAAAGGLASTLPDLARFVSLQFKAGRAGVEPVTGGSLTELHTPQRIWDGWTKATALAWIVDHAPETGDVVWHNGGMAGFRSWIGFSPRWKVGVIVLTNCGRSVDDVGQDLMKAALETYRRLPPEFMDTARALASYFSANPADDLKERFHEEFLDQIPFDVVKNVFKGLHEKHGSCKGVVKVEPATRPELARITYRFDRGDIVTCTLGLDRATGKIAFLRF